MDQKEPLEIVELGMNFTVAPDDWTSASGRPDGTEAEFQLCPSNGIVSSRAYLRHSSKQQEEEERIEREEIIPKEIKSLYIICESL